MFSPRIPAHNYNTRGRNNVRNEDTRTVGATKCLRHFIPEFIQNFDPLVLDKIHTHSPDGFSKYAKNYLLEKYPTECSDPATCNTCTREQQAIAETPP